MIQHYQNPILKRINKEKATKNKKNKNKKLQDLKVPMLKTNKSELKTHETLITQVTNDIFYKVDKNRLQLAGCISIPMQELIHQQNIKQKQH